MQPQDERERETAMEATRKGDGTNKEPRINKPRERKRGVKDSEMREEPSERDTHTSGQRASPFKVKWRSRQIRPEASSGKRRTARGCRQGCNCVRASEDWTGSVVDSLSDPTQNGAPRSFQL